MASAVQCYVALGRAKGTRTLLANLQDFCDLLMYRWQTVTTDFVTDLV